MKTITLCRDNIYSYSTKQEGYGRQGLYLSLYNLDGCPDQTIYFGSTYPNPIEHFGLHTWDDVFQKMREVGRDEDGQSIFEYVDDEYVDGSGNDVDADRIFETIFEGIVNVVSGHDVPVEEEGRGRGGRGIAMGDFRYIFHEKSDKIVISQKFKREGRDFDEISKFVRLMFQKKGIENLGELHRLIAIVDVDTLKIHVIYPCEKTI